jgi:hypothetical protein
VVGGMVEQRSIDERRHQVAHLDPDLMPFGIEAFGHAARWLPGRLRNQVRSSSRALGN